MAPIPNRVILLIDENKGEEDITTLLPRIHLTCLRLLSYYAHNSEISETKTALLWGYKFFNSTKQHCGWSYKQCPFLDFTTQSFDIFEKDLYRIYEEQQPKDSHTISPAVVPANKMRTVFTELLSDFHWERPELFSPSKQKHGKPDDEAHNFVYMFTPAPNNKIKMSSYFEQGKFSEQKDFIKILLPKSLFSKFVCQLKIKLCWIDTNNTHKDTDKGILKVLRTSLLSSNGSLMNLSQFSSWWMHYQSSANKEIFADVLNTSSLFDTITTNVKDADTSFIVRNLKYNFQQSQESQCTILISQIRNETYQNKQHEKMDTKNITFCGFMQRKEISPLMLDISNTFYYVMVLQDDIQAGDMFKVALEEKKMLKITWIPPSKEVAYISIMMPCTKYVGTILTLNSMADECLRKDKEDVKICNDPLALTLATKLNEGWEFGTSLVHCVDSWFVSNPNLGMKSSSKIMLRKLYREKILQRQRQEGQSKELLKALKKSQKDDKSEEDSRKVAPIKTRRSKKNSMMGVSWVRWRLMEYQKKQNESKVAAITTEEQNVNEELLKHSDEKEEAEKPLEVEEFKCQEDLRKYLEEEWELMGQQSIVRHRRIHRFVMSAVQFFSNIDEESSQELGVNFVKHHFHQTVDELKDVYEKQHLVHQYLLQVHLLLECGTAVKQDSYEKQDSYCSPIVAYLRAITFIESPSFIQNHLNDVITPCFLEKNNTLLQSIYEDLMFDIPECLATSEEKSGADDSPGKSINERITNSIGEYHSDDFSSAGSYHSERRSIKRIPSVVGDNSNRRMITVQKKKATATNKKRNNRRSLPAKSNGEVIEQNSQSVFDAPFQQPQVPKTPTFKRRHSEIILRKRIPETPEGKQKNDLIWKKQELNRRISKVDKNMKPIKESPLKDITSPQKRRSSLCRSYSFSCRRSSPRRFYAVRRTQPSTSDTDTVDFPISPYRPRTLESFPENSTDPFKVRSILFSNFEDDNDPADNETKSSNLLKYDSGVGDKTELKQDDNDAATSATVRTSRKRTRRNIFDFPLTTSDTSGTDSMSFDSADLKLKRRHSTDESESFCKKPKFADHSAKLEVYSNDTQSRQEVCSITSKFKFGSDNTMDWLNEIDKEDSNSKDLNFRDAFEKFKKPINVDDENILSPCLRNVIETSPNSCKQSPTIVRAGNESITVSPLLSATSLELLEKAPILSPVVSSSKSRKRRALHCEYIEE